MFYGAIIGFVVGVASSWFIAAIRPALGTRLAAKMITIGDIQKVKSNLFPELYVTVGQLSIGKLGLLLPLYIPNVSGEVWFESLPDGEKRGFKGLRWLTGESGANSIDIKLPGGYDLAIMCDNHGILCPGDDMPATGGFTLTGTYNIRVVILGPTKNIIVERSFHRAITDGKIIPSEDIKH